MLFNIFNVFCNCNDTAFISQVFRKLYLSNQSAKNHYLQYEPKPTLTPPPHKRIRIIFILWKCQFEVSIAIICAMSANVAHFASHYVDNGTDNGDSIALVVQQKTAHPDPASARGGNSSIYGASENFYIVECDDGDRVYGVRNWVAAATAVYACRCGCCTTKLHFQWLWCGCARVCHCGGACYCWSAYFGHTYKIEMATIKWK